ncbi:MAG: helix-turn-helix domain-containing protein [Treponema sp.]|nr:helix-turn-helix domain-containing protein [Treponema sp.]
MRDNAVIFWENIKREIKQQNTTQEWVAKKAGISFNTFQGWISKEIYPRVNDAVRIAAALDTSVEYLVRGTMKNNTKAIDFICHQIPKIYNSLNIIQDAVKELR